MNNVLKLKAAPWPIPHGWAYVWDDIHSIERNVGDYTLIVAQEGDKWLWWLCPKGKADSVARGEAWDMLDAVWRTFDALATKMGGACG